MRRHKEPVIYENIIITDIADEGKSIAKHDNFVIFLTGGVPGDTVDISIRKKKPQYAEGEIVKFHSYSPERATPFCSHFGICGGCKWQHMVYASQLKFKQALVENAMKRIAKVHIQNILPILPSPNQQFYRNKLEFTFSNRRWLLPEEIENQEHLNRNGLGFHIPGRFDRILDINACYLQNELSEKIRAFIKNYALTHHLPFFDLNTQEGLLRTLTIRTTTSGQSMIIVQFFQESPKIIPLLESIIKEFPEITSLQYIINSKRNDTWLDQEVICHSGKDYIIEKMGDLQFKITAKSFYQTNPNQAHQLYLKALDLAQLTGNEIVYDLYTGTGTLAIFAAPYAQKVLGIEYVPEAVADAKINAMLNHIHNVQFFAGDMKNVLNEEFITTHQAPQVIITDPPRAGMDESVTKKILEIAPQKIVYISCNPATQARDIAILSTNYEVVTIQPVDMFPQTHHVENIALLIKKQSVFIS